MFIPPPLGGNNIRSEGLVSERLRNGENGEKMEKKMKKKVEKAECEVIDSKDYLALKTEYDDINCIVNNVRSLLNETVKNYLKIGYLLTCLDENSLKKMGYESIYDFSKANFELGVTSTKNFINVYKRFAITNNDEENVESARYRYCYIKLKEEFEDYSMSQLVELLPVSDSELENYNPEMTTKEIRMQKKQSQLTDYEQNFYSLVEKRFKEIWSLVILDDNIKCVFNDDTKMLFDNYGEYSFNLVYEKEKIKVNVICNINKNMFWIRIESPRYDYHYLVLCEDELGRISLSEKYDYKSFADRISGFINENCIKFIRDEKDSKLEESSMNGLKKQINNLINQIFENSKNRSYRLIDFIIGDFFDLCNLLEKSNSNILSGLNFYLNKLAHLEIRYPHCLLASNLFKIEDFTSYGMKVSCPTDVSNLYLVIEITSYDLAMEFQYRDDDGNDETFTLEDALELFPSHLNGYFTVDEGGISLFSIYYNLAELWVKTIKLKEIEEENKEF